jgi:hypothetical protein
MPAPFPPNDSAIVRFRYTKAQPQRDPIAPPPGSPPGTPFVIPPTIGPGHEDTEQFDLHPPTGDIAEVERQWRKANPPDGDKEWQDAWFPSTPPAPTPKTVVEPPDVDAQGLRHRASGETETRSTVTEGVSVPGRGVGFADGEEGEDHPDAPTFGDDKLTLAQLDGLSDEQLAEKPGIGPASITKIHRARTKRDRAAAKAEKK